MTPPTDPHPKLNKVAAIIVGCIIFAGGIFSALTYAANQWWGLEDGLCKRYGWFCDTQHAVVDRPIPTSPTQSPDRTLQSNQRLLNMRQHVERMPAVPEPSSDMELSAHLLRITDFDKDRFDETHRYAFSKARAAADRLAESDRRLSSLTDLLPVSPPYSPAVCMKLAEEAKKLTPYDHKRGREVAHEGFHAALTCRRTLAESDKRLAEFEEAFHRSGRTGSTKAKIQAAEELADAYHALTSFDLDRTEELLIKSLPAGHAAAQEISDSNQRLEAFTSAWHDWMAAPSKATTDKFVAAAKSLTGFDQERFKAQHAQADEEYREAARRIRSHEQSLSPETKPMIRIFVTGRNAGVEDSVMVEQVRNYLSGDGFNLASTGSESDMVLQVVAKILSESSTKSGEVTIEGVIAKISLDAAWTYDGSKYFSYSVKSNGASSTSKNAAIHNVLESGAEKAAVAFGRFVTERVSD